MVLDLAIYPRTSLPVALKFQILKDRVVHLLTALTALIGDAGNALHLSLQQEFSRLIATESATISKICFAYSGSVAEFDDLRQDALINIWRGMKTYRGDASQRTWVYRVTVNSCLSTIRSQKRHQHESLESLYSLLDTDESNKEDIELMHTIVTRLGAQEKAITMMWLDQFTYDEIAAAMGLNRNTIATKLRRIKEKIATQYLQNI